MMSHHMPMYRSCHAPAKAPGRWTGGAAVTLCRAVTLDDLELVKRCQYGLPRLGAVDACLNVCFIVIRCQ